MLALRLPRAGARARPTGGTSASTSALPFVAFSKHPIVAAAWLYLPFAVLVVVWTSNAVNLTDGLDGLAIGPVMINAGTYLVWAYLAGATFGIAHVAQRFVVARYLDIPLIASAGELSIYCGAMVGAGHRLPLVQHVPGAGLHGRRRARSRSAAASGCAPSSPRTSSSRAILGGRLLPRGGQRRRPGGVASSSPGKRIFLMAPIHHHYEKKGWAEPKIIVRFWIISILLALVSLSSLKLR